MSKRVVVIGAGISGLTTAFWLHRGGADVTVMESASGPGGTMKTIRDGEWLIETGPNSALETTPIFGEMFDALGLSSERLYAEAAGDKRYILRDGTLHALPMSAGTFLRSRLWTAAGKVRLMKEPFIGRASKEETIAEFVERRLGREFLDYAINPFVAGVYAGNPEQLSVRAAFPKLYALEEKYGGLIKGMIGGARERKQRAEKAKDRARMFSFASGMETFPATIAARLDGRVRCNSRVTAIERSAVQTFKVRTDSGASIEADGVVVSVPAQAAAALMQPLDAALADSLNGIFYPPVAEVFLGFREGSFRQLLDGFGYLIPAKERRAILGTIWSSVLFPNRAPAGHVAFTSFVGGSRQPSEALRSDKELTASVTGEINAIMGGSAEAVYSRVIRWDRAIPQYNLGYHRITDAAHACEMANPGLFFCSNWIGGIAVGDCVMNGKKTAERIMDEMGSRK